MKKLKNYLSIAGHNLETSEITAYKNAFDLVCIPFVLISDKLQIIDVNNCAKDLLQINLTSEITTETSLAIRENSKIAQILDSNGALITNHSIQYNNKFIKWEKKSISINNASYFLLLGIDTTERESLLNILQEQAENAIGYVNPNKSDVQQYINQISNYYTSIIEKIPCYIYWKNIKLEYLGCNQLAASFVRLKSPKDIIGKTDFDIFIDHELAKSYQDADKEILSMGKSILNQLGKLTNEDGETFYTLVSKAPISDLYGNIIGLVGITVDVTETEKAKESAESALKSLQQAQTEEQKQREEAERLAIENAAHKAELETQAKFITVVNRIAHDVSGSMGVIKKMAKYFLNLKEITAISGYEMRPISASEREDNIIYIQADDNGLQYEVLDSQKELKKGVASWEQLFAQLRQDSSKIESDFLEFQKEYLPILLEYTEKLGFTKKKMIERRIPEAQRVQLENSTQKAMTIMEGILSKYLNPEENQDESISVFPPSLAIHDAFAETRLNYEHQGINFIEEFNSNSQMVFIEGQRSQINRAITNLLRNAAQALDGKPGDVVLKLDSDEFYVYITIQDTGKGMPSEMVNKIKNNIAFTEGKKDGHGIGLGQVHATLNRNFAEMDIISELGKSTQFIIKFKKSLPPNWAAQTIEITPKDKVIIVDDDPSIHGDWGFNFEPIIEKHPSISIHNFYESQKALDYIHSLPLDEQNNILLLSDFELAHDARNGLNVIEESKVKRAFLVTSHCNEPDIQQALLKLNAKLLPKKLNQYIPIIVLENKAEYSEANLKEVDGIWLDDDAGFTLMHEQDLVMSGKKVDIYRSPKALMDNIHIYPKHIPILLDNNFEATSIRGTGVAKDLHERGFTKLFLVSGDKLNPNDYPYLTILGKGDLDDICKYF